MQETFNNLRKLTPLLLFSLVIFFICVSDAIMSYMAPVVIENSVRDSFLVGLIMSISSMFGILFDLVIAKKLVNKNYEFLIKWMVIFSLLFVLSFIFVPKVILTLSIMMILWSVYYELRDYSRYDFIHRFLHKDSHTLAWSIIITFGSTAYMLGPAIVVNLIPLGFSRVFLMAIFATLLAGVNFLILKSIFKPKGFINENIVHAKPIRSIHKEISILRILFKKIWPLFLFNVFFTAIDTCFWTMGILYAEKLRETNPMGGLFIVLYGLPTIIIGIIANKLPKKFGKKRVSFITGILSGISLLGLVIFNDIYIKLLMVFLTSTFHGVGFILLNAVYEDYVARFEDVAKDIVSITQLANNFAFSLGPIILGFIAKSFGLISSFTFVGISIIIISVMALIVVPIKIRLPRKELVNELNNSI